MMKLVKFSNIKISAKEDVIIKFIPYTFAFIPYTWHVQETLRGNDPPSVRGHPMSCSRSTAKMTIYHGPQEGHTLDKVNPFACGLQGPRAANIPEAFTPRKSASPVQNSTYPSFDSDRSYFLIPKRFMTPPGRPEEYLHIEFSDSQLEKVYSCVQVEGSDFW